MGILKDQIQSTEQNIADYQEQLVQLNKQLVDQYTALAALQKHLDSLKAEEERSLLERKSLTAQMASLDQQIQKTQVEVNRLMANWVKRGSRPPMPAALVAANAKLAQLNSQKAPLEHQLKVNNDQLNKLAGDISLKTTEISKKTEEIEAAGAGRIVEGIQESLKNAERVLLNLKKQQEEIDKDFGRLPDSDAPVAMLPVRLETRFHLSEDTKELLLRIYPDSIHIDAHEPELTIREINWGKHYWEQIWRLGTEETGLKESRKKSIWGQLVQEFGAPRAAWVAHALRPENPHDAPIDGIADGVPLPRSIQFPKTAFKTTSWSKAPWAKALPDRWLLTGYRASERVLLAWSEPVKDLQVGPDPQARIEEGISDEDLAIEEEMRWLVDFDSALAAGMAIRIPLTEKDATEGFDKLVVIGVKNSLDKTKGTEAFGDLMQAKYYTTGLAFIPKGTPSNNTDVLNSGYSSADLTSNLALNTTLEVPANMMDHMANAPILAKALGVEPAILGAARYADLLEEPETKAMNEALWPISIGYFLKEVVPGFNISKNTREALKRHFLDYVRAMGPFAPLRIGKQPYGILPICPMLSAEEKDKEIFDDNLAEVLHQLRPLWTEASKHVPRSQAEESSVETLFNILGMDAISDHLRFREVSGLGNLGNSVKELFTSLDLPLTQDEPNIDPNSGDKPLSAPLVQTDNGLDNLEPNYIEWLAAAGFDDIFKETFLQNTDQTEDSPSILYRVLRHATLLAFKAQNGIKKLPDAYRESLMLLKDLPVERLEQLFKSTLDLFSHRLDAWITSTATKQLMRVREVNSIGLLLGGIGWVENLRPAELPQLVENPPEGEKDTNLVIDPNNGGFVHAPSIDQAATAALLRNNYLSKATNKENGRTAPMAINLSSGRVRIAMQLLEGIRQGQPLSGLLGYRFERGLHERGLDQYIESFRILAPLGAIYEAKARLAEISKELEQAEANKPESLLIAQTNKSKIVAFRSYLIQINQKILELNSVDQKILKLGGKPETPGKERKRRELGIKRNGILKILIPEYENQSSEKGLVGIANEYFQDIKQNNRFCEGSGLGNSNFVSYLTDESATIQIIKRNNLTAVIWGEDYDGLTSEIEECEDEIQSIINEERTKWENLKNDLKKEIADKKGKVESEQKKWRDKYLLSSTAQVETLESIAAQKVVDGVELLRRWRDEKDSIPWGDSVGGLTVIIPDAGEAYEGILAELDALEDAMDAVGDLITAESVYQTVKGEPIATGASLEAIARGEQPPSEIEVIRTPRGGVGLTHRVMVLFSDEMEPDNPWPTNERQIRAAVEPQLNAWGTRVLGDPRNILIQAEYCDLETEASYGFHTANLQEIGLSPLDLIFLSKEEEAAEYSDLEQYLMYYFLRNKPGEIPEPIKVKIIPTRQEDWEIELIGLNEIMEVARAAYRLITNSRYLHKRDLYLPGQITEVEIDLEELRGRVNSIIENFDHVQLSLSGWLADSNNSNLEELRDILLRIAHFGIPQSVPKSAIGEELNQRDILVGQAQLIYKECKSRFDQLNQIKSEFEVKRITPDLEREYHLQRIQILLGEEFLVLPKFKIGEGHDLNEIFGRSFQLQDGDPHAVGNWFQRIAKVRTNARYLEEVSLYTEALTQATQLEFEVGQLPVVENDRWAALPLEYTAAFPAGKLSMAVQFPNGIPQSPAMYGLMIDEWTEVIPNSKQTTGVTFNFDAPGSRPPQAIILAVPPAGSAHWDLGILEKVALETIELFKIRGVDLQALGETDQRIRQILPGLYFALDLEGEESISTDFTQIGQA